MTALGARKAILMNMQMMNSRSRIEFRMPSRGLFGYRSQFLTDTHGEGIMNTIFDGYEEWCGDIQTRSTGSLISFKFTGAEAWITCRRDSSDGIVCERGFTIQQ